MSSQPTYYPTPPALDFGSIAIGDSSTKSVRIEYRLAPAGSAGEVVLTQTSAGNEIFLIDDQGTNGADLVTLSQDGSNFFNRLNLSNFPATEPANFITIDVRVAPTRASTNINEDFVVYLRSIRNKPFSMPIHFRIVGGQYVQPADVRRVLGPIGRQKNTLQVYQDMFSDTTFPLWTNSITYPNNGPWTAPRINNRTGVSTTSVNALSTTVFSDFGDYQVSVVAKLQSSGDAGLVWGYVNNTNFFRSTISPRTGNAVTEQIASGTPTILSQVSVGGLEVGKEIILRVEKHPTSADYFVNESLAVRVSGISATGHSGITVTSSGGNPTTSDFREYHVTQDVALFQDADINDFILEEQKFVELRTGRIYVPQMVTELLDYNEQDVIRMPFIANRTFNTFPSFDPARTGQPVLEIRERAIYLKHRPVMNVVAVEENENPDSGSDSWELRTQGRDGDYLVYPELGKIIFVNNLPRDGHQNIRVIYTVGTASVPLEIRQYVAYKTAYDILTGIGGTADGIEQMVEKIERKLKILEEFIPQKTLQYAVGSGQYLR